MQRCPCKNHNTFVDLWCRCRSAAWYLVCESGVLENQGHWWFIPIFTSLYVGISPESYVGDSPNDLCFGVFIFAPALSTRMGSWGLIRLENQSPCEWKRLHFSPLSNSTSFRRFLSFARWCCCQVLVWSKCFAFKLLFEMHSVEVYLPSS